jgi:GntR family transcriptional regulator
MMWAVSAEDDSFPEGLARPLDRSAEVPVGAQLSWRLRMLIASGVLEPGDRLPSARELARAVRVNVNTIFTVYGRLEAEGLIQTQHGRGSFVLAPPPNAAGIAGLARQTALAARAADLDVREIAMSLFADQPPRDVHPAAPVAESSAPEAAPGSDDPIQRRELREEINLLERELARLQPLMPANDPTAPTQAQAQPRVLGTAALRIVRDQLRAQVDALKIVAEGREAEARARRRSRATTTLDRPAVARPREHQPTAERIQPRSPIVVRWTPHWGTT